MEELSNPLVLEAIENDDFSLIDGSSLDDLLDSMSETSFVDNEVNIIDEGVNKVEKPEAAINKKNQEYNPRKSLAWDSAFNCAGFLDAEELSSIIEGSNSGRHQMQHLPGIQEDISKSTDSLSTLESDNLTLESLEADLFCDISSSIQRSGASSKSRMLNSNRGPEGTDFRSLSGTKSTSLRGNMVKQKSISRKINASIQGDARLMKLGPVREQVGKPGVSRREPQASLSKLPAASDGKNLRAMTAIKLPSKRMPIATGRKNSSLHNVGNTMAAGSGTKVSKGPHPGDSYSTIPKAALSAKSSSQPSTSRIGTSSTRSSFDSTTSSSVSSRILPLNGMQGKSDRTVSIPPSSLRSRLPSRVPLKGTIQLRTSCTSAYQSTPKHSPSSSPTSYISEWSSSSSVATVNQEHYVSKDCSNMLRTASLENISSCDFRVHPIEHTSKDQEHEVTGVPNISAYKFLADSGSKSNPVSAKQTGLRMPSPKIGFFDGVKTGGKTPKAVGMQSGSGLPTSRFVRSATGSSSPNAAPNRGRIGHAAVKATAIAAGNSNSNTQRSNARLAPTGRVDDKSTALMKASDGTIIENVSTNSPKIKGQNNNAVAKISDGGKRFSESGSSSRKKSGLISLKKNASPEGMRHLKGNQVSGVAEADHHPLEICNDSKVLDIQLFHGLISGDTTDTELELINVPKEVDSTSIVDDENANIVAKSGGDEAGQACVVINDQQNVSAEQQENGLSGHVEAVDNKRELCEDMKGNFEPQNTVNFANGDTQLFQGLNNEETTDTKLDLVNVSKEVDNTSNDDDENTVAVAKSGGNEATNEKYDRVCGVITGQQNFGAEQMENGLSRHVEAVGNETELCEDLNGNFEPRSTVNCASSDTQLLHGLINGDTAGTELDLVDLSTEADSTFNVDDENTVAMAKGGGNEAMNQKYDLVCVVITDQENASAEQMENGLNGRVEAVGNEPDLCEDMDWNFEPQSIVNFDSESHLPAVSSCAVELSGFNLEEEAADLSSKHTEFSTPSSVLESNPGPRTPFADKNSLSDAYSMEALVKNFSSLTLNSVQRKC